MTKQSYDSSWNSVKVLESLTHVLASSPNEDAFEFYLELCQSMVDEGKGVRDEGIDRPSVRDRIRALLEDAPKTWEELKDLLPGVRENTIRQSLRRMIRVKEVESDGEGYRITGK